MSDIITTIMLDVGYSVTGHRILKLTRIHVNIACWQNKTSYFRQRVDVVDKSHSITTKPLNCTVTDFDKKHSPTNINNKI